jgi:hypothetical protein
LVSPPKLQRATTRREIVTATFLAVQMDALARLLESTEPLSRLVFMTSEDVVLSTSADTGPVIAEQFRVFLDPATLEALIMTATLCGRN